MAKIADREHGKKNLQPNFSPSFFYRVTYHIQPLHAMRIMTFLCKLYCRLLPAFHLCQNENENWCRDHISRCVCVCVEVLGSLERQ